MKRSRGNTDSGAAGSRPSRTMPATTTTTSTPTPDAVPFDAVEQYICQVENQLDLARELDNCVLYGESTQVLRVAHEKLKELLKLADGTLAEMQRRGIPIPESIAKKEIEKQPVQEGKKWARWTTEEDAALEEAIAKFGEKNLKEIAAHLETKNVNQCRERIRRAKIVKEREAANAAGSVAAATTATSPNV